MRTVLLAAVAVFLFQACSDTAQLTVVAKEETINLSIKTTGELTSSQTIQLGPPVIKNTWRHTISYLIDEGTWVKKGQKVMSFDSQEQIARLRELKNSLEAEKKKLQSDALNNEQNLESLKLDLAEAKMQLDRADLKAQYTDNLMTKIEVQKLQIDYEIARKNLEFGKYRNSNRQAQAHVDMEITEAEIKRLQAEVAEMEKAIRDMEVTAPKDGIVVYVPNNDGEKPAEGDQVSLIQKVVELPNLETMIIETTIPEQVINRVRVGQQVKIAIDAIPERAFAGEVASLGQIVRVKSREEPSMVFDAIIKIRDPDIDVMRPGMAARLEIIDRELENVVSLPASAVVYEQDQTYVRVNSLFGPQRRAVTIAGRQSGTVILSEGVSSGDEILL